jgi:hypothetical protein
VFGEEKRQRPLVIAHFSLTAFFAHPTLVAVWLWGRFSRYRGLIGDRYLRGIEVLAGKNNVSPTSTGLSGLLPK